ncbi:MAG: hypothetical protein GY849_21930 [Deltaproteobacteria bacterium]|nr:hypothetical protein [Deltaproteobacteria bacterium]
MKCDIIGTDCTIAVVVVARWPGCQHIVGEDAQIAGYIEEFRKDLPALYAVYIESDGTVKAIRDSRGRMEIVFARDGVTRIREDQGPVRH